MNEKETLWSAQALKNNALLSLPMMYLDGDREQRICQWKQNDQRDYVISYRKGTDLIFKNILKERLESSCTVSLKGNIITSKNVPKKMDQCDNYINKP